MAALPDAFQLSVDELNYFVSASIVLGAAFTAYQGVVDIRAFGFYLLTSASVLLIRELGQRSIAHWMEATVNLELSLEGTAMTVFGAGIALVTEIPFIFPFPVSNSFSLEAYEQWGKSIDAMWSKRMAWIVSGGITAMFGAGLMAHFLGLGKLSGVISLFLVFQLLPFDYPLIPTGTLDGAYLLRHSEFKWMLAFGLSLLLALLV